MKHRRFRIFLICFALAAAMVAGWFFRPFSFVDASQVHPRLSLLKEPFRLVNTSHFLDGGTIGIDIIDATGATESFCFPASTYYGTGDKYSRLYVGSAVPNAPGSVEITGPEHTKRRLVNILTSYPEKGPTRRIVLAQLSERPVDSAWLHLQSTLLGIKSWLGNW